MRCIRVVVLALAACGDNKIVPDAAPFPQGDGALDAATLAAPDLRFQWVGVTDAFQADVTTNIGFAGGAGGAAATNNGELGQFVWTPMQIEVDGLVPANYAWFVTAFTPVATVQPVGAIAKDGPIASLDADLAGDLGTSGVVTSLDVLSDAYAYVVQSAGDGVAYAPTTIDVPRDQLDAAIASEAALGHVTTAVSASPTAGDVRAYAFARFDDLTAYQTMVLDATPANLADQAMALAAGGYIITGFGHVADDSMILVGTRANTAPRTVTVQAGARTLSPDLHAGDAVVASNLSDRHAEQRHRARALTQRSVPSAFASRPTPSLDVLPSSTRTTAARSPARRSRSPGTTATLPTSTSQSHSWTSSSSDRALRRLLADVAPRRRGTRRTRPSARGT